jgi:hypothetical protein
MNHDAQRFAASSSCLGNGIREIHGHIRFNRLRRFSSTRSGK